MVSDIDSGLNSLRNLVLRNSCDLSPLDHSLCLLGHALWDASNRSVFTLVAKFCPALTELTIDGFCLNKKDIMGLCLGELVDMMVLATSDDTVLKSLKVAPAFMSPLCFTLQQLSVKNQSKCFFSKCSRKNRCDLTDSYSVFALRHLPALTKFKFEEIIRIYENKTTVDAIKLLHDNQHSTIDENLQQEFDQICEEAASRVIQFEKNLVTSPQLHSGVIYYI